MSATAIIPARLGSTRFPRKVLADATGVPLIVHVVQNARRAESLSRIVVATDDASVERVAREHGIECVMTSPTHPNGTARLAEAARVLGLGEDALVVNVQGDEPELEPEAIDAAVAMARKTHAEVATVASPLTGEGELANPNIVKVVRRRDGIALYFSRAAIPHARDGRHAPGAAPLRHVGLYVYRTGFLLAYAAMESTPLEQTEMLEQLRVLESGGRIAVAVVPTKGQGIDTPEQYAAFVERWRLRTP
jgi:3-deoxy-manno-octulosonate cytidylyltransferase (CMP-KDO synthetase)